MGTEGSTMLAPLRQSPPPVDPCAVSSSVSCALPGRYESVKGARRFTHCTLRHWELEEQFDAVALVVSELVTNALRHALPQDAEPGAEALVRLHLMRWSTQLLCAVRDSSPQSPLTREMSADDPDCAAESGRGLYLVDAFSDSWGWQPLSGTLDGKVVWALFRLPA